MTYMKIFILIIWISSLLSCGQSRDSKTKNKDKPKSMNTMNDIEKLLDSTMPFLEGLIKKHGEFFPLASAIKTNDSIAQVGTYDGDDRPLSDKLIADLKNALRAKRNDYRTIAIFYDVKVVDPSTKVKTDAIAVFVETKNDDSAFTFYYPYTLTTDKELIFSNPWKNKMGIEIFND